MLRDELGLVVHEREESGGSLEQANQKQIVVIRMKDVQVPIGASLFPVQMARVNERKTDVEAGRMDNHIDLLASSILE